MKAVKYLLISVALAFTIGNAYAAPKTVTVWGYISSANLQAGEPSNSYFDLFGGD